MRNLLPKVGVRMPACAREPGLGRTRHALGHTEMDTDPQEVMSAPTTYRGDVGAAVKSSPHSRTT